MGDPSEASAHAPPQLPRVRGRRQAAALLHEHADPLAARVVDALYAERPDLLERWGERGRRFSLEDSRYHVRYLAAAVEYDAPDTFLTYVDWVNDILGARNVETELLALNFRLLRDAVRDGAVPDLAPGDVVPVIDAGIERLAKGARPA